MDSFTNAGETLKWRGYLTMKQIAVLGSTGSIGTQTLEVVRANEDMQIVTLAAGSNIDLLEKQIVEFTPKLVCVKMLRRIPRSLREWMD